MSQNPLAIVRVCLEAYVTKDRAALEAVLADEYHFTSPLDNALDRATYLQRCWPGSAELEAFDLVHGSEEGELAFITYEARTSQGKRFRNTEVHTVRDGKLVATEVYFGWTLPHEAPPGGFVEKDPGGA